MPSWWLPSAINLCVEDDLYVVCIDTRKKKKQFAVLLQNLTLDLQHITIASDHLVEDRANDTAQEQP